MGWVKTEKTNKLSKLGDIDFTTTAPIDGNALVYDETNNVWVPGEGGGGSSGVELTQAEYDALTQEEKNNGSIYKITDKAKIYCLDEEYHAVLEITSADYALLTSDEKNNGTLYILTDEETTADDIPYSAGVSVADKLDSLTASVNTVNSYTASYDSTKINQGNVYAYSIGKILMITGYMRTTIGNIPADTVIGSISGITLTQEIFASAVGVDGTGLRLMVYTDGRLRIERQMPANEWFSFTMIGFLA